MPHPNFFLEMELEFKKHLGSPEIFRAYLQNNKSGLFQYLASMENPGKTAHKIVFEVVRRPELLHIFLEESYGIHLFRPILKEVLQSDNVESMKVIFGHPPYHGRLNQRASLLGLDAGYFSEDFVDLLIHGGPRLVSFLLNHSWMDKQLTITRFMEISSRLTEEKLRIILRHKKYREFLYAIESPYAWIENSQKALYGSFFNPVPETKKMYDHVQKVFLEERRLQTQQNWRFLFFCIILGFRAKEFRERFWAPGGQKALALQEEFEREVITLKN